MDRVALKLVIGPANAEKAGVVLDGYRAALGLDPLLVVPTAADVHHYRRELAASGAVFGVSVMRFGWLMREIARRCGPTLRLVGGVPGGRTATRLARERIAAAAIVDAELGPLARSAATAGFETTLLTLVDELQDARATPARAIQALRAWGAAEPTRAAYAEDLASLVTDIGASSSGLASSTTASVTPLRSTRCGWHLSAGARRRSSSTASTI